MQSIKYYYLPKNSFHFYLFHFCCLIEYFEFDILLADSYEGMLSCVVFNGVLFRSGFLVAETLCVHAEIDPEKYVLYIYVVWIYNTYV